MSVTAGRLKTHQKKENMNPVRPSNSEEAARRQHLTERESLGVQLSFRL